MEKVLRVSFCALVLVSFVLGIPSKEQNHAGRTPIEKLVAKTIATSLLTKLKEGIRANPDGVIAPKDPLLPPLPDPDCFGPWHIPLDINFPEFEAIIAGDLNVTSESKLHGFSTIFDDLVIRTPLLGVGVRWDFQLPKLTLEGDAAMDLSLTLGESSLPLVGGGPMEGSVEEVFLLVDVVFNQPLVGFLSLRSLDFDLGFKNFNIDLGDVTAGDEVVDWVRVSEGIQTYFDTMWNEEVIGIINEALSCILDFAVSGCRNLLEIETCLNLDLDQIDAKCFASKTPKRGNNIANIGNVDAILASDPFVVCIDFTPPTEDPETTTTTTGPTTTEPSNGDPTTTTTTTTTTTGPTTTEPSNGDPTTTTPEATTAGVSSLKPLLSILLVAISTVGFKIFN